MRLKILLCTVIIASYLYAFLFGYVTFYIKNLVFYVKETKETVAACSLMQHIAMHRYVCWYSYVVLAM